MTLNFGRAGVGMYETSRRRGKPDAQAPLAGRKSLAQRFSAGEWVGCERESRRDGRKTAGGA